MDTREYPEPQIVHMPETGSGNQLIAVLIEIILATCTIAPSRDSERDKAA
ncbi:MAG TPA: hypothetical protein PKC19_23865 [Roseiflexaceae bacterium]|nr:hypothetical protein [Roseiflexaceae bacterium]